MANSVNIPDPFQSGGPLYESDFTAPSQQVTLPVYVQNKYTVIINDNSNGKPCDKLHAFQSTGGVVIGNVNVIVGDKLKELISAGLNVMVTDFNVNIDNKNGNAYTVHWTASINKSSDGEAWVGFTSRGAGCNDNIDTRWNSKEVGNDEETLKNNIKQKIGEVEVLELVKKIEGKTYVDKNNKVQSLGSFSFVQGFYRYRLKKEEDNTNQQPEPQRNSAVEAKENTDQKPTEVGAPPTPAAETKKPTIANQTNNSNDEGFVDFNAYKGNYVILNSDRLILNSKADSIFLTSNKTIGFSAVDQIHFNVGLLNTKNPEKNYIIMNSPLIQLGFPDNYKDTRNEPVAKAYSTIEFVNAVIQALNAFCDSLSTAKGTGVGVVSLVELNASAAILKQKLALSTKDYSNLQNSKINSKTSKTV